MELVKIEGTNCFTLPDGKYLPVTPWGKDPDSTIISAQTLEICKMFVMKSKQEKQKIYAKINDISVNLHNEVEFIEFISLMLSIDVINNAFCSHDFKLDEDTGYSTYTCGYHGWLKEIYSTTINGKTTLSLADFKNLLLNHF